MRQDRPNIALRSTARSQRLLDRSWYSIIIPTGLTGISNASFFVVIFNAIVDCKNFAPVLWEQQLRL